MATLNFFDTYLLIAINEEIVPQPSFFRDRYFPTGARGHFRSRQGADRVPQRRSQDGGFRRAQSRRYSHGSARL